jgi:MFS family permease
MVGGPNTSGDQFIARWGPCGKTLATELDASVATMQWVMTGYLLALGMAVPPSTWTLQRFGGRRLWMFVLAVFLGGSIGSSVAWNAASLIAWWLVQGVGGGLLMPAMGTLIMQAAAGRALGRTASVAMLPLTVGPIVGPAVGGLILTQLSWRYMFWLNVPFCLAGLVLAWCDLPDEPGAGIILMPEAVGTLLGRRVAGWATDKLGVRPAAVGATALVTVATVPFVGITATTSGWLLALWLLLRGLGLGAVGVPATAGAYRGLGRTEIAHTTVLTRTVVQLGARWAPPSWPSSWRARPRPTVATSWPPSTPPSPGPSASAATALTFWLPGRSSRRDRGGPGTGA